MSMPRTASLRSSNNADDSQRPWWRHWLVELSLILLVTAALRAYVTYRTPLITRDGMLYVGIARIINHGMWLDLVGDWFLFNPYTALMAWLIRCGFEYDMSGQLVSAVASSLAVVPLYLWCHTAFSRRAAQLGALTYALHPVALRISGQVLREGLYWCFMLWAVYIFWLAATQRKWLWFALAGLLTTAAALTRMEGAVVFALGAMWAFTMRPAIADAASVGTGTVRHGWISHRQTTLRLMLSFAMFPLTIVVLNLIFVPAGKGWHGCGRWVHFAIRMTTGQEIAPVANKIPDRMVYIVADERARAAENQFHIEDLHGLAKALPAWNPLGEPDAKILRLQRFLILASDQQRYLFIGRFLNACLEGLMLPCVFCCLWGLYYGRTSLWSARRDWPVAIMSVILCGLLFYHLATEYILEPRYMLCLIPFVFVWSGIGASVMYGQLSAWCATRPVWAARLPSGQALCVVLMILAVGKLYTGLDDRGKLIQRELGNRLRQTATKRLKIAGPESLKRVGHYADADYFIIPRGDAAAARRWLDQQPLDLVILSPDDLPAETAGESLLPEKSLRYRRWTPQEARAGSLEIYSVQHKIKQMGS